jgi:hypothetical protein
MRDFDIAGIGNQKYVTIARTEATSITQVLSRKINVRRKSPEFELVDSFTTLL